MVQIIYSGLKLLPPIEKSQIQNILEKELFKAERKTKNIERFSVNIKKLESEGKRAKISIHIRAEFPQGYKVTGSEAGWDIKTASHKAVDNLKKELEKRFKKDASKSDTAFKSIKKFHRYLRKKFLPSKD